MDQARGSLGVWLALMITACSPENPTNPGDTGGSNAGGQPGASGGTSTGGVPSSGGTVNTGGNTGGTATGGAATGGQSTGICPGGTYPAPTLTGTPTRVTTSTGTGLYEGTVWAAAQGMLLFSDMTTDNVAPIVPSQIRRVVPPSTVDVFVADSGTNGLALDIDNTLLGCSHKVQGIVRVNPTSGAVSTLLDTDGNGKHFNSPNDLTVRSDGTIYFTDPDYQLGSSRTSETGIKGVYRVTPSRQVVLVDGTFGEPNGIALSPDETVLYVADFPGNVIRRFTVASDGSTSGRQNFATIIAPDGVAVDCAGNLYWASNSQGVVRVFSPSGTSLGSITVASSVTNLAFGGSDRKTLYISAGRALYSLALNVPGYPY
jgi:gluconolactonase